LTGARTWTFGGSGGDCGYLGTGQDLRGTGEVRSGYADQTEKDGRIAEVAESEEQAVGYSSAPVDVVGAQMSHQGEGWEQSLQSASCSGGIVVDLEFPLSHQQ